MLSIVHIDLGVSLTLRLALALVFALALVHKLRAPRAFVSTVRNYRLLPARAAAAAAGAIVLGEFVAAVGLAAGLWIGSVAALASLLVYTVAIGLNLMRGRRDIDCGCSGPAIRQTLSAWLVWRNAALTTAAALTLLPDNGRTLSALDLFTSAAAVAVFALVYAAANTLAASASRFAT